MKLVGASALVTGASGGLGTAIATGLAREGAQIAAHGRDLASTERLCNEIRDRGGVALSVAADVRDPQQVDVMVQSVVATFGGLDILVNNAGIMNTDAFVDIAPEAWREVLDTNLTGYFLVGQRAARAMIRGERHGRIINVSSTRQTQAWPGSSAYCASKGGIYMLTRVMALELAEHGIRVNSIAPGTIPTNLNAAYVNDSEFRSRRLATIPAGRLGNPDDLVGAVVFLASDESAYVTGASLAIDGGQSLW